MPRSLRRKEPLPDRQALRALADEPAQTCRYCGCTDYCACEGGCWWVEPGVCSSCAEAPEI